MSRVILEGYVLVSDEDLQGVLAELPRHIELTLKESGCVAFQVTQDPDNQNKLLVYEEFIDQESFALHQSRAKASPWGVVSANLEKHYHIKEGVIQLF